MNEDLFPPHRAYTYAFDTHEVTFSKCDSQAHQLKIHTLDTGEVMDLRFDTASKRLLYAETQMPTRLTKALKHFDTGQKIIRTRQFSIGPENRHHMDKFYDDGSLVMTAYSKDGDFEAAKYYPLPDEEHVMQTIKSKLLNRDASRENEQKSAAGQVMLAYLEHNVRYMLDEPNVRPKNPLDRIRNNFNRPLPGSKPGTNFPPLCDN